MFAKFKKIKSIKKLGKQETYDISMEKETPYYIANDIVTHNSFSFNKSHATAYAMLAFKTMWLKHYYSKEFYCASLICETDEKEVSEIIKDALNNNIKFLSPDINKSKSNFSIEPLGIRYGLSKTKNVGEVTLKKIIDNQPYKDYDDFKVRSKANIRACANLCIAGFFDCFNNNRKQLLSKIKNEPYFGEDWSNEVKEKMAIEIYPIALSKHILEYYYKDIEDLDLINFKELDEIRNKHINDNKYWVAQYTSAIIAEVKPYWANWGDWLPEKPAVMDYSLSKYSWWSPWCKISVLDINNNSKYCNINPDVFAKYEVLLKSIKVNTPLIIKYAVSNKSQRLTITELHYMHEDLSDFSKEKYKTLVPNELYIKGTEYKIKIKNCREDYSDIKGIMGGRARNKYPNTKEENIILASEGECATKKIFNYYGYYYNKTIEHYNTTIYEPSDFNSKININSKIINVIVDVKTRAKGKDLGIKESNILKLIKKCSNNIVILILAIKDKDEIYIQKWISGKEFVDLYKKQKCGEKIFDITKDIDNINENIFWLNNDKLHNDLSTIFLREVENETNNK